MKKQTIKDTVFKFVILVSILALLFVISNPNNTKAATIEELRAQSNALQEQINANNSKISELVKQGDSLKGKIAEYDAQIAQADQQIQLINIKLQQLDLELQKAQKELDRQKGLLKASVATLYKKGGASTVELLVGSDSFSEFINDQTYLETLKSGIQASAEKVVSLKQQIQSQQNEQKKLLAQQEAIRQGLANARSEREQLLSQTQGDEARYRAMTSDLVSQQRKLLAEIVARSRVITGVGTGGYPARWANAPKDSLIDSWGMFNRECVSYAAWRVYSTGRFMPTNFPILAGGNATDWPESARMNGIATGSAPRIGSVAIWRGYWGHAAFVEDVIGNQIRVSEYNAVPPFGGTYSERMVNAGDPDVYIYF